MKAVLFLLVLPKQSPAYFASFIFKRRFLSTTRKKWFVFDSISLKQTIAYGWASAMQQATVQLGKLGVQSIVKLHGCLCICCLCSSNRIDDFGLYATAKHRPSNDCFKWLKIRVQKTNRIKAVAAEWKIELIYGILSFGVLLLAHPLMQLFLQGSYVVCKHGVTYFKMISLMYLFLVTNGVQGYFRGIEIWKLR